MLLLQSQEADYVADGFFFFLKTAVEHLKPCQFSVGNFGGGVSPSPNATINHAMVLCLFLRQIINTLIFSLALGPSSVGLLRSVCVAVTVNRIYGCEGHISCRSCEFPLSSASFDGTPVFLLSTSLLLGRWRASTPLYKA